MRLYKPIEALVNMSSMCTSHFLYATPSPVYPVVHTHARTEKLHVPPIDPAGRRGDPGSGSWAFTATDGAIYADAQAEKVRV